MVVSDRISRTLLLISVFGLFSCKPEDIIVKEELAAPVIGLVPDAAVVLDAETPDEVALGIEWSKASQSLEVVYDLLLSIGEDDKDSKDGKDTYDMEIKDVRDFYYAFSHAELNDLILSVGPDPETTVTMTVQIRASIEGADPVFSRSVEAKITAWRVLTLVAPSVETEPQGNELVLDIDRSNETALTLTWSSAAETGDSDDDAFIDYNILLRAVTGDAAEEKTVTVPVGYGREYSFTHKMLNDALVSLGAGEGVTVEVGISVEAVLDEERTLSETIYKKVTAFNTSLIPAAFNDNGFSSPSGGETLYAEFAEGSRMGVFVVNGGTVTAGNIPVVFENGSWKGGVDCFGTPEERYYAYFPYDPELSADKTDPSASTAEGFFAGLIAGFVPVQDQPTEGFLASDLMTGEGFSRESGAGCSIEFAMFHKMSIVNITLKEGTEVSLSDDPDYKWITDSPYSSFAGADFAPNASADGKTLGYIVVPETDRTFKVSYIEDGTTETASVDASAGRAGSYVSYTIGGKHTHTLAVGDIFMKDGEICPADAVLTDEQKLNAIGIVFTTDAERIGAEEKRVLADKGISKAHGLVIGLKYLRDPEKTGDNAEWLSFVKNGNDARLFFHPGKTANSLQECYNRIDGLEDFNTVTSHREYFGRANNFKAFELTEKYQADPETRAPEMTTGWYLPSIGQLWDYIQNLGNIAILKDEKVRTDDRALPIPTDGSGSGVRVTGHTI